MNKIDLFTNNKMSEPETDDFLRGFLRKIMDHELKTECMDDLEREYGVVRTKSTARRIGITLRWRLAAAIVFVVAATIALFIFNQKPAYYQLVDNFIEEEKLVYADLRKGADDLDQGRVKAVEAYQKENYPEAIQYWNALKTNPRFDESDQFFLAMSYFYGQDYQAAATTFEQYSIQYAQSGRFEQERLYYHALALLKLGQIQDALMNLNRLQQTTRSPVLKTRSEELIKAIKQ